MESDILPVQVAACRDATTSSRKKNADPDMAL